MTLKDRLIKNRKKMGLLLMGLGFLTLIFVGILKYISEDASGSFESFLRPTETIVYGEFPLPLSRELELFINNYLQINSSRELYPWTSDKGGFALIRRASDSVDSPLIPLLFLSIRSNEEALNFLKKYQNPAGTIKETPLQNNAIYTTSALSFLFPKDTLVVISPSLEGLSAIAQNTSLGNNSLEFDEGFKKIRSSLNQDYFIYTQSDVLPSSLFAGLGGLIPRMPPLLLGSSTRLGITGTAHPDYFEGSTYSILKNSLHLDHEQGYRALLLPYISSDFDILIAGQNLYDQVRKLKTIGEFGFDQLLTAALRQYAPGLNPEKEIFPLINSEFAITIQGEKILFAHYIPIQNKEGLKKIEAALFQSPLLLGKTTRQITLPDGTLAQEYIADTGTIKKYEENFKDITINGMKVDTVDKAVYSAFVQDKWFISNDLTTLKKALLLTKEPGLNFRDSALYKESLQFILKNPELLGIARLPQGNFSFSKRTFHDHMESNFRFMIK